MSFNHFNESRDYLYTSAGGRNKLCMNSDVYFRYDLDKLLRQLQEA